MHDVKNNTARAFRHATAEIFVGRAAPDDPGRHSLPYQLRPRPSGRRAMRDVLGASRLRRTFRFASYRKYFSVRDRSAVVQNMAGAVGIEPTMPESKSGALTAWPRPKKLSVLSAFPTPRAEASGSSPAPRIRQRQPAAQRARPRPRSGLRRAQTGMRRFRSSWHRLFYQANHTLAR